nr:hypothetical protein [Tanacetum cinerariifolium]
MGDANPICTLRDYSKPSHEGCKNTIELSVGNNVVPLRSDTIRLVQNGCSFHGIWSEDPNHNLKDLLKLVDSLDLDRSITTWEDLTTYFLAQLFPLGRTTKLYNNISMFQQHQGESLSRSDIDRAAGGKLRDKNADEYWEIIENITLYDHEAWNDSKNFIKPALGTTFEARVQDYMAAHTKSMERFENAYFKQQEEINDRMAEMFGLLKELTTSRAHEKVLINEEAKSTITNVTPPNWPTAEYWVRGVLLHGSTTQDIY